MAKPRGARIQPRAAAPALAHAATGFRLRDNLTHTANYPCDLFADDNLTHTAHVRSDLFADDNLTHAFPAPGAASWPHRDGRRQPRGGGGMVVAGSRGERARRGGEGGWALAWCCLLRTPSKQFFIFCKTAHSVKQSFTAPLDGHTPKSHTRAHVPLLPPHRAHTASH